MSDELTRRLRYLGRDTEAYEANAMLAAADLIDAQAKRIAVLEEALRTAAVAFEHLAAADDQLRNGVRASVRAAEACAALEGKP